MCKDFSALRSSPRTLAFLDRYRGKHGRLPSQVHNGSISATKSCIEKILQDVLLEVENVSAQIIVTMTCDMKKLWKTPQDRACNCCPVDALLQWQILGRTAYCGQQQTQVPTWVPAWPR
jgi:hypothetical protein